MGDRKPKTMPKPWSERQYVGIAVKFSRGRLGVRIGELLADEPATGLKVRVRLWDAKGKKWRSPRAIDRNRIVAKPVPSDLRWADIRKDVALDLRIFRRELAAREAAEKKRRTLAARVRAAKRLLMRLGYVVREPTEQEETGAAAEIEEAG